MGSHSNRALGERLFCAALLAAFCLTVPLRSVADENGHVADEHAGADARYAPWQAGLFKSGKDPREGHFCGAVIISQKWLVTAAHCLPPHLPDPPKGRTVVIGPAMRMPIVPLKLSFACEVAGTPVEFPNDIRISNPYNFTVQAGTVAHYSAPFGNTGTVVLPELAPGAGIYVSNAVPGGITAGTPCSASQA